MRSYHYNVRAAIPFSMLQEERAIMHLEMRVLDSNAPSKRDISYMLRFMYVQKKWFFYQKEKSVLRKLIYNYENYPNVLKRNTDRNKRLKLHAISSIQRLINTKKLNTKKLNTKKLNTKKLNTKKLYTKKQKHF